MSPATWPRDEPLDERVLVIDPRRARFGDAHVRDLPSHLSRGDLLVVNDAATLPASLLGEVDHAGVRRRVEVRLLASIREGAFTAALFGDGDWRTRTEHRSPPPPLDAGARIRFGARLVATIESVSTTSPRLVEIAFDSSGAALWSALYREGRPVQYAHVARPLELWHAQTRYAGRPWAFELPSAGRPLTWGLLRSIERAGVSIATLTHAAGLSSTGDARIDSILPLPERYDVPQDTVDAVRAAKQRAGRVVAVGTTVVRALEGCAASHGGALVAGEGVTDLHIGPDLRRAVVDGLFTGLHDPTASHFALLQAFAPRTLLEDAYAHAERAGYVNHEFGDSSLILDSR